MKKGYYIIILIMMLWIFISTISFMFLHGLIHPNTSGFLKNVIILFLLIGQTVQAKKPIRYLNWFIIPLFPIGYLFVIMHWPFGNLLFIGSLFTLEVTLLISALLESKERIFNLLILAYPVTRLLFMLGKANHFELVGLTIPLEVITSGAIIIATVLSFKKSRR